MKIAVLGQGPLAIHAALHFQDLGAHVVLYKKDSLGGNCYLLNKEFPELPFDKTFAELSSAIGQKITGLSNLGKKPTAKEYWDEYLKPLVEKSEILQISKTAEVVRVHKRFLAHNEEIKGRSRVLDLFRVIFALDPKESILKQVAENPEAFNQLGADVVSSLHESVEGFHDYDLVIDARGKFHAPNPMGASNTYALNEARLNKPEIVFYGGDFLKKKPNLENARGIVVVGSGETSALNLIKLKDWFFANPNNKLYLFTDEEKPFETIKSAYLKKEITNFFEEVGAVYESAKTEFEKKLHAWRDLEDYEKVKVQKPVEPANRFFIYNGYSIVAMDKLLDRAGVFVTAETIDFRKNFYQFSEGEGIVTVPADFILVGKSYKSLYRDDVNAGLIANEPGYFDLRGKNLSTGIKELFEIEKLALGIFTRQQ